MVLGATNRPWDLDEAVRGTGASAAGQEGPRPPSLRLLLLQPLWPACHPPLASCLCLPADTSLQVRRRLPKRIYVPLPDAAGRRAMVQHLLQGQRHALTARDLDRVVAATGARQAEGQQAWLRCAG